MTWSRELILRWIGECSSEDDLKGWIGACHRRLAAIDAGETEVTLQRPLTLGGMRYRLLGYRWIYPLDGQTDESLLLSLEKIDDR